MERWKPLPYSSFNHISISNTGRLRNDDSGIIYKLRTQPKTGLSFCDLSVITSKGKERKTIYIAREVAEAFIPKPLDFDKTPYKAMHKKGTSKLSNLVKNIEWVSQSKICKANMKKATPEVRNRIGKFNTQKFKGYKKKKYIKVADRPNYKPKPKSMSTKNSKLKEELEKEKQALNAKLELINKLLKTL